MAEIRSTMDMVMERAAKMAAEAKNEVTDDSTVKEGMRLAAEYLKNPQGKLVDVLQQQDQKKQIPLLQGISDTLLRNIVLPRDENLLEASLKALAIIADLSPGEVSTICQELQQILEQYSQHKEQMQTQLDDAIRSQLEQQLIQQGTQITEEMTINPTMHPQYAQEQDKMLSSLNGQYNEALDQRKALIRQRLVPGS